MEFSNLDKATAKTRELIVTYEMYKSGTLTKEQYDQYVQTKWLGQKTEQNFDEYDSKVYRGANGVGLKYVKAGPNAGRYYYPAEQRVLEPVSAADSEAGGKDDAFYPVVATGSGTDAGYDKFQTEEGKSANKFGDDVVRRLQASNLIEAEIDIILPILERSPRIVGVFDADESFGTADKILGSILTTLREGVDAIWGRVSLDLTPAFRVWLSDQEKADWEVVSGAMSKLGTYTRQEIAGQGPISDTEARDVAKQFGSVDSRAASLMAALRVSKWRAQITQQWSNAWLAFYQEKTSGRLTPSPSEFEISVWAPKLKEIRNNTDFKAMLNVNVEKPEEGGDSGSPTGDSGTYKGVDFKWRGNGDLQAAGQLFTSRYTIERWNGEQKPIVLEIWDARKAGTLNRGGKVVDPMRAKFYNKGRYVVS